MKFGFKKTAAGVLALALTASLCGCDKGYLMTVDGMSIRNGVYLSFQQTAYTSASSKIQEEKDDNTSEIDVFSETVEGKSASDWIKEETMKQVRKYVAVQRMSDENGVTVSDDEIAEMNRDLQTTWDEDNLYVQYMFGFNTMGQYYESMGIGLDSLKEIRRVNALSDKLFMHFYGADGTYPVTADEINEYLTENYAAVKMLTLSYADYAAENHTATDEEKQAVNDKAKAYVDRLNGSESFIDVKYEIDLEAARDKAKADAEDSYDEHTANGLSKDEYVQKAVDEATAEKAEKEEDIDQFISKTNSTLDEKLTEYIWNAAADGKASVFETDSAVYVVAREDVTTKETWKENNDEAARKAIKGEEYDSMVELTCQSYAVEKDDYLVDKKYDPEKVNKRNSKNSK
ncbi:MAG: hypothetical protein K2N38_13125 [Oscillospiraceae bacterium]|nr:hypothetical protein [Oscillospiraceae bacterium]